jgi:predicted regulator of Ras-like GTPase activity (Roadblock/LC7/MglB family)
MSSLAQDIREKITLVLKDEEEKTDLDNLSVLSRVGMKVSSAYSSELDADATSASSTALIDLGLRLSEATAHGALREIILHNASGYSILMAINDDYIVFSGLKNVLRIGYYLGYLRELVKKLNILISGDSETEMVLSLQQAELEKLKKQREEEVEEAKPIKPTLEQDKAALDGLLGFLDDWEKEGTQFEELEADTPGNIVSIPKGARVGIPKAGETVGFPQGIETQAARPKPEFKVYDDEVPPIPLDDYTPMEIEEEGAVEEQRYEAPPVAKQAEKVTPSDLPSFEELVPPDFDVQSSASEYDTEFILEEESETLDSVLKDLGWDEED